MQPQIQEGSDQGLAGTNIDSISGTQKKARGPTSMMQVWNERWERPVVVCNKLGQPEEKTATKLSNYVGTITRIGKIAPLDFDDWHKMPKENKELMWKLIQMKFDIPADSKTWAMQLCGKKIKDWKATLKRKYYNEYLSYEDQMQCKDERVSEEHWEKLIMHWDDNKFKELSNKNKVARAARKYNHTTGTKSFARVRAEEKGKMGNKSPPRAHLFKTCYKRKDGVAVSEDLDDVINQLSAKENENPNETLETTIHNDVFAQVMGNDKNGRVRMYGLGVSPSDLSGNVRGHKSNQNKRLSAMQEENSDLRTRNKFLESRLRELNRVDVDIQDVDESDDNGTTFLDHNYVKGTCERMQKHVELTPFEKSILFGSNHTNGNTVAPEVFNYLTSQELSLLAGCKSTNVESTSRQGHNRLNFRGQIMRSSTCNPISRANRTQSQDDFNLLEQSCGARGGSVIHRTNAREDITPPDREMSISNTWSFSSMLNGPCTQVGDEVVIKSIINVSETIAFGILESTDPFKEVEGEQLGSGYWEVYIQTVVKHDERLIRPYGQIKTIGDAIGAHVVWPAPFVASPSNDARLQMINDEYTTQ